MHTQVHDCVTLYKKESQFESRKAKNPISCRLLMDTRELHIPSDSRLESSTDLPDITTKHTIDEANYIAEEIEEK